jgi:hypothetical protein
MAAPSAAAAGAGGRVSGAAPPLIGVTAHRPSDRDRAGLDVLRAQIVAAAAHGTSVLPGWIKQTRPDSRGQ